MPSVRWWTQYGLSNGLVLKTLPESLLLAQGNNNSRHYLSLFMAVGTFAKHERRCQKAIAAYTEQLTTSKSLRNDLVAISRRSVFFSGNEVRPVYRQLVDLLLQSELGSQPSQQNLNSHRSAVIESLQ